MLTYNPIKDTKDYKNGIFAKIPISIGEDAVLLIRSGEYDDILKFYEKNNITVNTIRKGKYNQQVRIDMSNHRINFDCYVNAKCKVNKVRIDFFLDTRVVDPAKIYRDNICDMAEFVKISIIPKVRSFISNYSISEIISQGNELNSKIEFMIDEMEILGIENKNCIVDIQLDEETLAIERKEKYLLDASRLKRIAEKHNSQHWYDVVEKGLSPSEAVEREVKQNYTRINNGIDTFNKMLGALEGAKEAGLLDENIAKAYLESKFSEMDILNPSKHIINQIEEKSAGYVEVKYPEAEEVDAD